MLPLTRPTDIVDQLARLRRWLYVTSLALGRILCGLYMVSIADEGGAFAIGLSAVFTTEVVGFFLLFLFAPRWLETIEYVYYHLMVVSVLLLGTSQIAVLQSRQELNPDKLGFLINSMVLWLAIFLLGAFLALPLRRMYRVLQVIWAVVATLSVLGLLALHPPPVWRLSYTIGLVAGLVALGLYTLLTIGLGATRRRREEEALHHSQRFLERVLAASPSVVHIFDCASESLMYANTPFTAALGYPAPARGHQASGTTLEPLLHPDDLALLSEQVQRQRAMADDEVLEQEARMRHADGDWRWFATYNVVFSRGPAGEPAQILGQSFDITARKQAEATVQAHADTLSRINVELTRALRLKDEFLAMISHELRTPLNIILSYAEGVEEGLYGPLSERQQEALGKVLQSGRHLLALVSDILDLTYLDAGKSVLDVRAVDVDVLCRSALQVVHGAAQQKGLRLLRTVAGGVEGLRADEQRLTQILVNLLDNAVKFTPAGGTVGLEVAGDASQERIVFTVWDTGIGIAPEDMDRLFQPFTQVDGRLTRSYEGIGLGLTLVGRLADMQGGSVSLESTPHQGSRFTVSLPWSLREHIAPAAHPGPAPTPSAWVTPPRLVIADDHELTLQFYTKLLGEHGCQVVLARTGVEAVTQVRVTRPDLALIDIQMPGLDGLSAIRQIRADREVGATPIIALTALAMPGDRERCLAAGANMFFAKPVGIGTLVAVIAELLAGPDRGRTGG